MSDSGFVSFWDEANEAPEPVSSPQIAVRVGRLEELPTRTLNTADLPLLVAVKDPRLDGFRDAVLAAHPHLTCSDSSVLRHAFKTQSVADGALAAAGALLEKAVAELSEEDAEYVNAMRTLDMDDRDKLEVVLAKHAPAFATALKTGNSAESVVLAVATELGCPGRKRSRGRDDDDMSTRLAEWRAEGDDDFNDQLDAALTEIPLQVNALVQAGTSLEGVKVEPPL